MSYKGKFVYEITTIDVGKPHVTVACESCGHTRVIRFQDILGQVLTHDVGKRIYEVDFPSGKVYQVESQEQLEKRLS